MIYTCTLNPSLDYVIQSDDIRLGEVNMATFTDEQPGGKGINVSRMLTRFGVQNKALGFVGGFTGDFILSSLEKEKIDTSFIRVNENTRINVKIKSREETEINGVSPTISSFHWNELLQQFHELKSGDFLALSGSVPHTLPQDAYALICKEVFSQHIRTFVDAKGDALLSVLPYRPFLLKPNHHELGELFNVTIDSPQKAKEYAYRLLENGAQNVIVSMAGDGALLVTPNESFFATSPVGKVVNSVGAGDSLVGGFIATYSKTNDIKEAFRYGVASGSATAFSLGLGEKSLIDTLVNQVSITSI